MCMFMHGSMQSCKMLELLDDVERHTRDTRSFNILEGKVMAILPFEESCFWFIWARHSCFTLTHLWSLCVRLCVLSNLCKQHPPNSTSDWLTMKFDSTSANRYQDTFLHCQARLVAARHFYCLACIKPRG